MAQAPPWTKRVGRMEEGMVGASFGMISEQSTGNRELESGIREQGSEIRDQRTGIQAWG
jgi:hypothetical protein